MIEAPVPDDHAARTITAFRDDTLEILVLKRVVFDHDSQPLQRGIERGPPRHGPALEHPVELEPEIIVQGPGRVLMDDKHKSALPSLKSRFGFRRFLELPFRCVFL